MRRGFAVTRGVNEHRRAQLLGMMGDRGWELMVLYGDAWRKEFFRCLVNVNFEGPYAAATLDRSGEIKTAHSTAATDFQANLLPLIRSKQNVAVAGLELMEKRFVRLFDSVPTSATADVEELRRVKTPEEIDCLRRAADLADRGYEFFAEVIEPGMAEFELVAEVEGFLKTNGAEDNFMLIASGGVEVTGMKPPTERRFQIGDQVTTELTPCIDGYYAQICRTLVLGDPSPQQRQAFAIFSEARQAAEDLLKPGIDIGDVARVQNDVFRKFDYGEYTGPQYTRVRGHNLGLYPDEQPHVLEDVHYSVKKDMVVIAHPNTYLPLSGYMVYGDTLLVNANGCESLNRAQRKLFVK
jgi:Xaa-Pro aminopeptidase